MGRCTPDTMGATRKPAKCQQGHNRSSDRRRDHGLHVPVTPAGSRIKRRIESHAHVNRMPNTRTRETPGRRNTYIKEQGPNCGATPVATESIVPPSLSLPPHERSCSRSAMWGHDRHETTRAARAGLVVASHTRRNTATHSGCVRGVYMSVVEQRSPSGLGSWTRTPACTRTPTALFNNMQRAC